MYYDIRPTADDDGNMMGLDVMDDDIYELDFDEGEKMPGKIKEPIRLEIEDDRDEAPFPSFLRMPVPLMSKKLLDVVRKAGVNNIDAYKAELYWDDGELASKDYYVVNIIGAIAAADMDKSIYDPDQPDRMIAMSFDALTVDERKAHGYMMFRLAENIGTILIHEDVRKAIEKAKIPLIEMDKTEDIAIL